MKQILFENCAGSVASCVAAEKGGAGRIELCSALTEGGTTPSYGLFKLAKQNVSIPIFPIIRPRSGDFLYSDLELREMEEDIIALGKLGADGFATGVLTADGKLDIEANRRLIRAAGGKPVTLHRAIDRTRDMLEAVEDAIELGFSRILTSGGMPTAPEGVEMISKMVAKANGRIIIMAGCGVRPENGKWLVEQTGVTELHGTFQGEVSSLMNFKNAAIQSASLVVDEWSYQVTDSDKVKALLSSFQKS